MDGTDDPRVARTRARVLEAARALLLEEGLDAVTHLRVAERSGAGRRTLYRHWPERVDLLRDALATPDFPRATPTGRLREDLLAHLEALRRALVEGPLARIVVALLERAAVRPELHGLRRRLTEEGCEPARALLRAAVARGELPPDTDVDAARAALEGPLFYRAMLLGERVPPAALPPLVDTLLAAPPRTGGDG